METIKEQSEFITDIQDNTPLSKDILKLHGFKRERKRNIDLQLDGLWYNDFMMHEDFYTGEFSFATMVRGEDKCMKSGYSFKTLGRLKALYFGVTGRKLQKVK